MSVSRSGRTWRAVRRLTVSTTVVFALMPRPVSAQSVTALSGLDFGTIITGTSSTVAVTSASAMSFRISSVVSLSLSISLTLPASLNRVGGGGTMPVTFCSTCARYRVNNSNPSGGTTFNPANGVNGLVLIVLSNVYVWLGGSVSPPLHQAPGSYTGTVVLTMATII